MLAASAALNRIKGSDHAERTGNSKGRAQKKKRDVGHPDLLIFLCFEVNLA